MIKTEKINIIREKVTVTCDYCSEEIPNGYRRFNVCRLCKRDMCNKHSVSDPETAMDGDYSEYLCIECGEISKPYFKKIDELEEVFDEK